MLPTWHSALFAVSRRLCVSDRFVRGGKWPAQTLPLARKVSGKRLGILGLGTRGARHRTPCRGI